MAPIHGTQDTFKAEVLDYKGVVMVDFHAEWCGPCKVTSPIIDQLANEMPNVKFIKIDVDQNQDLASEYSIFSIPSFLVFKDGKVVGQSVGAQSKDSFKDQINKALAS